MNKILAIIAGIGGFLALLFRSSYHKAKAENARVERDRAQASEKTTQDATEALVKGVTHESKKSNPRSYDFSE